MIATVLALALSAGAQGQPQASAPAVQPITLAQAVERARRESPLRAGAAAAAEGADIAATLAGRRPNPSFDFHAENLGPRNPLTPTPDVFAILSQPIELGGKRGVRRDLAGTDRTASSLLLRSLERQLALDTVRSYMRALRARGVLTNLTTQREGVGTLVTTMRRRVEEGFAPESDLLRFEAEAARVSAEITRTQIELGRALMDLGTLIGSPMPLTAAQLVAPDPVAPPSLDDAALNAAVDERPDLLLASTRVDRARLASDLEHLKRLPDPIVNAGYKRTAGQNTAVTGVILAVPLFDRNGQARALAEAGVKSAAADRQAAHLRAVAEASAAIAAATQLATSLTQVRRDLVVPAEGVRNAAQALFREGATDVLKLVDAERIYADVRREALALAVDAYVAAIEARFAVAQEDIP